MKAHQRLLELATAQDGVITRAQALAVGVTDRILERHMRNGQLQRLKPGTYLLAGIEPTYKALLRGATLALPAVVSHESAAELHLLPYTERGSAVVTVLIGRSNRFPGVTVHQSTDLSSTYVDAVAGFRVTNIPRTVLDLAAVYGRGRLERVVDHCLASSAVTLEELTSVFENLARRGKRGFRAMREILEERGASPPAESVLERRLLQVLDEAGVPEPVRQHRPDWLAKHDGRVDFSYLEEHLIVEVDGRRWHTLADAFEEDRRRDNLALLAGWRVLRFTWHQVTSQPGEVAEMVRAALDSEAA